MGASGITATYLTNWRHSFISQDIILFIKQGKLEENDKNAILEFNILKLTSSKYLLPVLKLKNTSHEAIEKYFHGK